MVNVIIYVVKHRIDVLYDTFFVPSFQKYDILGGGHMLFQLLFARFMGFHEVIFLLPYLLNLLFQFVLEHEIIPSVYLLIYSRHMGLGVLVPSFAELGRARVD